MAILMMATRSHIRPLKAPRVTGTDRITVDRSIPTKLNDLSAAAQPRKARANSPRLNANAKLVHLR